MLFEQLHHTIFPQHIYMDMFRFDLYQMLQLINIEVLIAYVQDILN